MNNIDIIVNEYINTSEHSGDYVMTTTMAKTLETMENLDTRISTRAKIMKEHTALLKELASLPRGSAQFHDLDQKRLQLWASLNRI